MVPILLYEQYMVPLLFAATGLHYLIRNYTGDVLFMFSKYVGIKNSNETKVLAIMEARKLEGFLTKIIFTV